MSEYPNLLGLFSTTGSFNLKPLAPLGDLLHHV
jgi:hypothetical protein